MKKIIIIIMSFFLVGCSKNTALSEVFNFYSEYQDIGSNISSNLDEMLKEENLSDENKELYKKVYLRQYKDMEYSIDKVAYSGNNAYVYSTIEVYDMLKTQDEITKFLKDNEDLFNDNNGNYDIDKYYKYKFNEMLNTNNKVKYNVVFNLDKLHNKWTINNLDDSIISKINGIYKE